MITLNNSESGIKLLYNLRVIFNIDRRASKRPGTLFSCPPLPLPPVPMGCALSFSSAAFSPKCSFWRAYELTPATCTCEGETKGRESFAKFKRRQLTLSRVSSLLSLPPAIRRRVYNHWVVLQKSVIRSKIKIVTTIAVEICKGLARSIVRVSRRLQFLSLFLSRSFYCFPLSLFSTLAVIGGTQEQRDKLTG